MSAKGPRRLSALHAIAVLLSLGAVLAAPGFAVESDDGPTPTEIRQGKRMLKQAEEHLALDEGEAAAALYEQLIQTFSAHPVGFSAHLGLAEYLYELGEYERALDHYSSAAQRGRGPKAVLNPDSDERARALFQAGMCHVVMGNGQRSFPSFRAVISTAPGTEIANRAYYQIARAHHEAGNYTQAISNYRMVGTSLSADQAASLLAEIGKPLSVRVTDRDFLILDGAEIEIEVRTDDGDRETLLMEPLLGGSETYIGEIPTSLGAPREGDGALQCHGGTSISLHYLDHHTASGTVDVQRDQTLTVVASGSAALTDAAYRDQIAAAMLEQGSGILNLRVTDLDQDTGAEIDQIEAEILIERPMTPEELDLAESEAKQAAEEGTVLGEGEAVNATDAGDEQEERWVERDRTVVTLKEDEVERRSEMALGDLVAGQEGRRRNLGSADQGMRTGVFIAEVEFGEEQPEAEVGDRVTIRYRDVDHLEGDAPRLREAVATVVPGTIAELKPGKGYLADTSLRVRKELLLAETHLRIGEVYDEMGLTRHAGRRFDEALKECQDVGNAEGVVDQELREQTLYTLWRIFLAKGDLASAAETCRTLQVQFPGSDYIDDSLLDLGRAAAAAGQKERAITLYLQVVNLPNGSPLAPAAQFEIAELYAAEIESLNDDGETVIDKSAREQAIQAYRSVFTTFPESAQATDALRKTGDLYFKERNFTHAIDFFEKILRDYPDAPFLADVLFNLARSYVLKGDARQSLEIIGRLERNHPGYGRMETAIKLRAFIQKKML